MAINTIKIFEIFPTQEHCIRHLENVRWQGKPTCPYCNSQKSTPIRKENRHHCNYCNTAYSVTVGTVFQDTRLDLQKWFLGIVLILNSKQMISARQLAKELDVNKNTGWYISIRIRNAMKRSDHRNLLMEIVENFHQG